jgi:hypothetical protein
VHRQNSTAAAPCGLPFSRAFEDNDGGFGTEEIRRHVRRGNRAAFQCVRVRPESGVAAATRRQPPRIGQGNFPRKEGQKQTCHD